LKTRILQIIPTLDRGGAERQFALLAAGLPRDRFDVHVCVLTRDGPLGEALRAAEIQYTLINKTWKVDPAAFLRLKRHIADLQPDIVHTWLFAANSYGRIAAIQNKVKCLIAGERCVDSWKSWRELAIDRRLAKRTQCIITNSQAVRDFYERQKVRPALYKVIHNAVEQPVANREQKRAELFQKLNLPADSRLLGAVGRLWPQKRVKDLIWAADLLKCVRDDTHLLIVGDGPQRWRLEKFRDQCDIRDRVHFLGERSDAREIIAALDCLWLASSFEGQSNVVLEAMAAGVPVVATDIPGMREVVVHEETGFLLPVGDRAKFVQQTRIILEDSSVSERFSLNARQRIAEHFSLERMIDSHAELYESLV
jgi:glycosyltransferase involved in cell wall biosynthesis